MDIKKRNLILMLSLLIGGSAAIAGATIGIQYSASKKNSKVNNKNAIRQTVISTYSKIGLAKPFYRYSPIRDNYLIYLKNFSIVYNSGSVELLDDSKSSSELEEILNSLKNKETSIINEINETTQEYEKYISKINDLRKSLEDIVNSSTDQNEKDAINKVLSENNPDDMQILSTYKKASENLQEAFNKYNKSSW